MQELEVCPLSGLYLLVSYGKEIKMTGERYLKMIVKETGKFIQKGFIARRDIIDNVEARY